MNFLTNSKLPRKSIFVQHYQIECFFLISKVLKFILENQSKYKIVLILKVANIVRPISIDKISLVTNKLTEGNVTRQPLQKK